MKLVFLLIGLISGLVLISVLRLPKSFFENQEKRKLFRRKKREEDRQNAGRESAP